MSTGWPRLICDPIHRLIPFENTGCDRLLLNLIDTPEFQRLRRIKQLGMADMVFPGATHTRFAHSLGVMHTTRRLLNRLEDVTGEPFEEYTRTIVLCSALLHDTGHGPFSHAFEKVTGENHERRTREVILDPQTHIGRTLAEHDGHLAQSVAALFGGQPGAPGDATVKKPQTPRHLKDLVTSQLDADRFDYLLRDAWATGTEFGRFDLEYLLANLKVDSARERLYLSGKARAAAESYVEARTHMYRAVYFHKTIRSAEIMLRLTLGRYQELSETAKSKRDRAGIVPGANAPVTAAFAGGRMDLRTYLALDDVTISDFLKAAAAAKDPILRRLAAGIIERRLWKALDVTHASRTAIARFYAAAREACAKEGYDDPYAITEDEPKDTAYKRYDPDAEEPATQIYVGDAATTDCELSQISPHVRALTTPETLTRYHFPPELRPTIDKLRKEHLQ